MEEERKEFENITEQPEEESQVQENAEDTEEAPLLSDGAYHPRPTWQKVLAWALFGIVVIGLVLWYLEIATAGSLFGLLD